MNARRLGWGLAMLALLTPAVASEPELVWEDALTASTPVGKGSERENRGGVFRPDGWQMDASRGYLRITLPKAAPREGELRVKVTNLDPARIASAVGPDKKIHFFNAFSNPSGDHHAEAGGTERDALWTLRMGTDEAGGLRYRGNLKLLWASRGAKRTAGSDYHEQQVRLPAGWRWEPSRVYQVAVRWSARERTLRVAIDGQEFASVPWRHEGDPLRYVFLGGAADFAALSGAVFSELQLFRHAGA